MIFLPVGKRESRQHSCRAHLIEKGTSAIIFSRNGIYMYGMFSPLLKSQNVQGIFIAFCYRGIGQIQYNCFSTAFSLTLMTSMNIFRIISGPAMFLVNV